jgi:hypothetical protein
MASAYEFILSMKNMASTELQRVSQELGIVKNKTTEAANAMTSIGSNSKIAQTSVMSLKGTLGGLVGILGTVGVGVGFYQLVNMMQQGIEKAHELHQAEAQVRAGLISTGGAARMSYEALEKMAGGMSDKMLYSKAQIMDMQAQMLTFGGLTKENFPKIGQAIADVSTKTGMDLHTMSIQFGKAMDNPSDGIRKLSRQGVIFSKAQAEQIDILVGKGNIVKAQQIMLTEIQNKYGGSALAAFNADPLARYNKAVGKLKMMLGNLAVNIQTYLAPTLIKMANFFRENVGKVIAFGKSLWEMKTPILILVGALGLYEGILMAVAAKTAITTWWTGLSTTAIILNTLVTEGWSAAWMALNIVMSANPLGIIIGVIAILAAGVVWAWNKFGAFRGVVMATLEVLKGFGIMIKDYVINRFGELISGIGNAGKAIWAFVKGDWKGAMDYAKKAGSDLLGDHSAGIAKKQFLVTGMAAGMAYNAEMQEPIKIAGVKKSKEKANGEIFKPGKEAGTDTGKEDKDKKDKKNTIIDGGKKMTNITVTINKLVDKIEIFASNSDKGIEQMGDKIQEQMLRAVNSVLQMQTN